MNKKLLSELAKGKLTRFLIFYVKSSLNVHPNQNISPFRKSDDQLRGKTVKVEFVHQLKRSI